MNIDETLNDSYRSVPNGTPFTRLCREVSWAQVRDTRLQ